MSNFKSQAKRKRELAKLDKRQAKDQKRALRKAERSGVDVGAATPTLAVAVRPAPTSHRLATPAVAPAPRPLTLTEAVERWKSTRVAKPTKRY
jgi:hypothetical protein